MMADNNVFCCSNKLNKNLFCLMLLANSYTISKGIAKVDQIDDIFDSLNDLDSTTEFDTNYVKSHVQHRRDEKSADITRAIDDTTALVAKSDKKPSPYNKLNAKHITKKPGFWSRIRDKIKKGGNKSIKYESLRKKRKPISLEIGHHSEPAYEDERHKVPEGNVFNSEVDLQKVNCDEHLKNTNERKIWKRESSKKDKLTKKNTSTPKYTPVEKSSYTTKKININPYLQWENISPVRNFQVTTVKIYTADDAPRKIVTENDPGTHLTSKFSDYNIPSKFDEKFNISQLITSISNEVATLKSKYHSKSEPYNEEYKDKSEGLNFTEQVQSLLEKKIKALTAFEKDKTLSDFMTSTPVPDITVVVGPNTTQVIDTQESSHYPTTYVAIDNMPSSNGSAMAIPSILATTFIYDTYQINTDSTHDLTTRSEVLEAGLEKGCDIKRMIEELLDKICRKIRKGIQKTKAALNCTKKIIIAPTSTLKPINLNNETFKNSKIKLDSSEFQDTVQKPDVSELNYFVDDYDNIKNDPVDTERIQKRAAFTSLKAKNDNQIMYDTDNNFYQAFPDNINIPTTGTSLKGLSSKLSYNEYVDGYKHYLNFLKKEQEGGEKFSDLVRYQAHKHHNVDDIGKYILDKLPKVPVSRIKRRFDDESDPMDDQDVSTKSDESWFKKHFYVFIDNSPPKKYHTSQKVALKSTITPARLRPDISTYNAVTKRQPKSQSEQNDNSGLYTTPSTFSTQEVNIEDLLKGFETNTPEYVRDTSTESIFKGFVPQNIIGKFFGNKGRRGRKKKQKKEVMNIKKTADLIVGQKRERRLFKNFEEDDDENSNELTTETEKNNLETLEKNQDNSQKTKREDQQQQRVQRYNPFKKLKALFKTTGKTNTDALSAEIAESFRPMKYYKEPSVPVKADNESNEPGSLNLFISKVIKDTQPAVIEIFTSRQMPATPSDLMLNFDATKSYDYFGTPQDIIAGKTGYPFIPLELENTDASLNFKDNDIITIKVKNFESTPKYNYNSIFSYSNYLKDKLDNFTPKSIEKITSLYTIPKENEITAKTQNPVKADTKLKTKTTKLTTQSMTSKIYKSELKNTSELLKEDDSYNSITEPLTSSYMNSPLHGTTYKIATKSKKNGKAKILTTLQKKTEPINRYYNNTWSHDMFFDIEDEKKEIEKIIENNKQSKPNKINCKKVAMKSKPDEVNFKLRQQSFSNNAGFAGSNISTIVVNATSREKVNNVETLKYAKTKEKQDQTNPKKSYEIIGNRLSSYDLDNNLNKIDKESKEKLALIKVGKEKLKEQKSSKNKSNLKSTVVRGQNKPNTGFYGFKKSVGDLQVYINNDYDEDASNTVSSLLYNTNFTVSNFKRQAEKYYTTNTEIKPQTQMIKDEKDTDFHETTTIINDYFNDLIIWDKDVLNLDSVTKNTPTWYDILKSLQTDFYTTPNIDSLKKELNQLSDIFNDEKAQSTTSVEDLKSPPEISDIFKDDKNYVPETTSTTPDFSKTSKFVIEIIPKISEKQMITMTTKTRPNLLTWSNNKAQFSKNKKSTKPYTAKKKATKSYNPALSSEHKELGQLQKTDTKTEGRLKKKKLAKSGVIIETESKYIQLIKPHKEFFIRNRKENSNRKSDSTSKFSTVMDTGSTDGKERANTSPNSDTTIDIAFLSYDNGADAVVENLSAKKPLFALTEKNPKAKVNTPPEQYFTTPLPMTEDSFEKFLRDNGMDVRSLTSPLKGMSDLVDYWKNKTRSTQPSDISNICPACKPTKTTNPMFNITDFMKQYQQNKAAKSKTGFNPDYVDQIESNFIDNDKFGGLFVRLKRQSENIPKQNLKKYRNKKNSKDLSKFEDFLPKHSEDIIYLQGYDMDMHSGGSKISPRHSLFNAIAKVATTEKVKPQKETNLEYKDDLSANYHDIDNISKINTPSNDESHIKSGKSEEDRATNREWMSNEDSKAQPNQHVDYVINQIHNKDPPVANGIVISNKQWAPTPSPNLDYIDSDRTHLVSHDKSTIHEPEAIPASKTPLKKICEDYKAPEINDVSYIDHQCKPPEKPPEKPKCKPKCKSKDIDYKVFELNALSNSNVIKDMFPHKTAHKAQIPHRCEKLSNVNYHLDQSKLERITPQATEPAQDSSHTLHKAHQSAKAKRNKNVRFSSHTYKYDIFYEPDQNEDENILLSPYVSSTPAPGYQNEESEEQSYDKGAILKLIEVVEAVENFTKPDVVIHIDLPTYYLPNTDITEIVPMQTTPKSIWNEYVLKYISGIALLELLSKFGLIKTAVASLNLTDGVDRVANANKVFSDTGDEPRERNVRSSDNKKTEYGVKEMRKLSEGHTSHLSSTSTPRLEADTSSLMIITVDPIQNEILLLKPNENKKITLNPAENENLIAKVTHPREHIVKSQGLTNQMARSKQEISREAYADNLQELYDLSEFEEDLSFLKSQSESVGQDEDNTKNEPVKRFYSEYGEPDVKIVIMPTVTPAAPIIQMLKTTSNVQLSKQEPSKSAVKLKQQQIPAPLRIRKRQASRNTINSKPKASKTQPKKPYPTNAKKPKKTKNTNVHYLPYDEEEPGNITYNSEPLREYYDYKIIDEETPDFKIIAPTNLISQHIQTNKLVPKDSTPKQCITEWLPSSPHLERMGNKLKSKPPLATKLTQKPKEHGLVESYNQENQGEPVYGSFIPKTNNFKKKSSLKTSTSEQAFYDAFFSHNSSNGSPLKTTTEESYYDPFISNTYKKGGKLHKGSTAKTTTTEEIYYDPLISQEDKTATESTESISSKDKSNTVIYKNIPKSSKGKIFKIIPDKKLRVKREYTSPNDASILRFNIDVSASSVPMKLTFYTKQKKLQQETYNNFQIDASRVSADKSKINKYPKKTKIEKRHVRTPRTYTAKSVAAIEVVVDLLKNEPSTQNVQVPVFVTEKKSKAKGFPRYYFGTALYNPDLLNTSSSTNSIQVHIAIPYGSSDKKRSVDGVRVRKVFSAKLSTPVDLEYQINSVEENLAETTTNRLTRSPSAPEETSNMLYLLVGSPEKNRIIALQPLNGTINLPQIVEGTTHITTPKLQSTSTTKNIGKVTLSKEFISSINKHIEKLYENLTAMSANFKTKELVKKEVKSTNLTTNLTNLTTNLTNLTSNLTKPKRGKRGINWEDIKRYFGHDRVCSCQCKPNKPMCRTCAACDSVMRELIFEFDNLANFMSDHCTEIQTYFWMNPSGGKKLRNAVHRIDRSLNDYYKRVKGKCQGRTCKMFSSTLDQCTIAGRKDRNNHPNNQMLYDLETLAHDLQCALKLNIGFDKKLKEESNRFMHVVSNCTIESPNDAKQRKPKSIKNVYELDNISVNLICNPQTTTELYTYVTTPPVIFMNMISSDIDTQNMFDSDIEEPKKSAKKSRGIKRLFFHNEKKKKKEKPLPNFISQLINEATPTSKLHRKREIESPSHIELPIITDTGGSFWHDYINKVSKSELRITRDMAITGSDTDRSSTQSSKDDKVFQTVLTKDSQNAKVNSTRPQTLNSNIYDLLKLFGTLSENTDFTQDTQNGPTSKMENINRHITLSHKHKARKGKTKYTTKAYKITNTRKTISRSPQEAEEIPSKKKMGAPMTVTQQREKATLTPGYLKTRSIGDISSKIKNFFNNTYKTTTAVSNKQYTGTSNTSKKYSTTKGFLNKLRTASLHFFDSLKDSTFKSTTQALVGRKPINKKGKRAPFVEKSIAETSPSQSSFLTSYIKYDDNDAYKISKLDEIQTKVTNYQRTINPIKTSNLKDLNRYQVENLVANPKNENGRKNLLYTIIKYEANVLGDELKKLFEKRSNKELISSPQQLSEKSSYENYLTSYRAANRDTWKTTPPNEAPEIKNCNEEEKKTEDGFFDKLKHTFGIKFVPCKSTNKVDTNHLRDLRSLSDKEVMALTPKMKVGKKYYKMTRPKTVSFREEPRTPRVSTTNRSSNKLPNVQKIGNVTLTTTALTIQKRTYQGTRREAYESQTDNYLCDLHATFEYIQDMYHALSKKQFEDFSRTVRCHKYKKTPDFFYIDSMTKIVHKNKKDFRERLKSKLELTRKTLKWDWRRGKRSLLSFDDYYDEEAITEEKMNKINAKHIYTSKFTNHECVADINENKQKRKHKGTSELTNIKFTMMDSNEYFEKLMKGEDGVYRRKKSGRSKRTVDLRELVDGLRNLPPLVSNAKQIYAMQDDCVVVDCFAPNSTIDNVLEPGEELDEPYVWWTDRQEMLKYDNVAIEGPTIFIKRVKTKNVGNYSCSKGKKIRRIVQLTVASLPEFSLVFTPTYSSGTDCTYDDLLAIQTLGDAMADEACACEKHCFVRVDEPVCLSDKDSGLAQVRATIVMSTPVHPRVKCSVQCRRDLHSALALLSATNAPNLASVKVVIAAEDNNKSLTPCFENNPKMFVTHALRKKDSNRHSEFHKLTANMRPGDVDMVVSCPAGFYLVSEHKICVSCPADTCASEGENTCAACPRGTRAAPGAAKCRLAISRLRRYELWQPPGGYRLAGWLVVVACGACALCAVLAHVTSRTTVQPVALTVPHVVSQRPPVPRPPSCSLATAQRCSSSLVYSVAQSTRGRNLSPSRVILAKFFKGSPSPSSRATDSQETRFELWKEKNMPPPLPPIDFDE